MNKLAVGPKLRVSEVPNVSGDEPFSKSLLNALQTDLGNKLLMLFMS